MLRNKHFLPLQQLFLETLRVTSIMDFALAGDSRTRTTLTGSDIQGQQHPTIQALITIILVGKVRYQYLVNIQICFSSI